MESRARGCHYPTLQLTRHQWCSPPVNEKADNCIQDWDQDDLQACFVNIFLFAYNRPENAGSTQMHLGGKRDCQEQHSAKGRILCQRSVRVCSFDSKTKRIGGDWGRFNPLQVKISSNPLNLSLILELNEHSLKAMPSPFKLNVRSRDLIHEIAHKDPKTVTELFVITVSSKTKDRPDSLSHPRFQEADREEQGRWLRRYGRALGSN